MPTAPSRSLCSRTEYLLKLEGAEIGEEFAGKDKANPSRVPADLLEEVFELNMQLDEMRMARKMGEEDPALHASLTEAKARFETMVNDVDQDLRKEWTVWDKGDVTARQTSQNTMVALLDRRRYLSNLLRDVTETLGA
jgi:molecular chaperone HscB